MPSIQEFTMPDLGEGLEDGEIVEWTVEVGDRVELNQVVAVVESAKATVELPTPFAGIVVERVGEVGDIREVGTVLIRISDEDLTAAPLSEPEPAPLAQTSTPIEVDDTGDEPAPLVGFGRQQGSTSGRALLSDSPPTSSSGRDSKSRATPPVRKLAKQLGVVLESLGSGSGPEGRITRDDVTHALEGSTVEAEEPRRKASSDGPDPRTTGIGFRGRYPGEVEAVTGIRKRIVEKMETSRRTIPDAGCARDTDFTSLTEMSKALTRQAQLEGHEVKISPFVLVCRATLLMLRRFPPLNSVYDGEAKQIRLHEDINLGIAVDTPGGLLVANVKKAHQLSTLQLATAIDEVVTRCRDGRATPADLTGGTFTVNNFGYFGNDDGNPIINAPEAGILGIGAIRLRPWVVGDQIVPRRIGRVTLSFDHRVCDGGDAGRATTYLSELCENPVAVLLHA
ncbi:hypothetical protein CH298_26640 [Rhodococcoides fascians]|uniref:dihydrolipoamide acetyltransferase family protein n=1 Tax=Rhodococcoides fascians TaxID=1828 RepID=UPI000B9BBA60|nr:dihydrolipoamide acetyltransferase family protein [Rhodococcus fascians]OZE81352.1 hypothetical protein CH303_27180 [Rhodococcus fascians]OZF10176.1 hypothetical protein CH298_26640 [Rhodococcus fascians]OZF13267.1 hypothetical protein CH297_26935 [Rhodococcus fascians]OZF59364.1 hypothetical protein CH308_27380 [Rhodococcus fascians]OZF60480.1 hypothetical protein CH307_27570 [Rhodococcus fascians]